MTDVVGIGSAVFDILMTVEQYPQEDTKLMGTASKNQCGGPCATALVAISKLGLKASYLGNVGDDMYGDGIVAGLKKYNVDCSHVKREKDAISFHSFVMLNVSNSSRTCIWNRGTVGQPKPSDVDLDLLKDAKYLHLDGHQTETAVYAAMKARELNVTVSLDAGGVYPGIEKLMPYVDVLIPSEEFALKFTKQDDVLKAAETLSNEYGPKILIITQGSRGGFIYENGKEVRYPVFKVNAVDSNGAGDTFHGAFVAARIRGMNVMEAATFASATSALKCTRFGAQEGIPSFDEVQDFIARYDGGEIK